MSNNIQNQKSGLAKLMATENLTVQHSKVATAMFDPKNRVLICPIWSEMSGDLYDLLMGHEVGHAIDTPAEGWHGAVHNRGRNYKGFLNVVEDARIEKRQKRRYPGLRKSFVAGFDELMKRDFFGLKGRDINSFPFIDRLNIFSKSGYTLPVLFNQKEQDFIVRVQACETFEDVLKLTEEIWDYSKEEQNQIELPQDMFMFDPDAEFDDFDSGSGDGDSEIDSDGAASSKAKGQGEDGDEQSENSKSQGSSNKKSDEESDDEDGNIINRKKESKPTNTHSEPRCETDENFRQNERSLIAPNAREYVYVNIPKPDMKRIITPAKRVHEIWTQELSKQKEDYEKIATKLYDEFRKKNERFVSLLAKEFEMRKAADKFSKAKTSETGDLDISRIFKYQIDDNIFKRVMRVPKGKSHGLVLLIDKSGSMSENLAASYEQILVLALFCRKVNIPFTAYGYGNAENVRVMDYPNDGVYDEYGDLKRKYHGTTSHGCFTENNSELLLSSVFLREMINSRMSNSEFSRSMKNILCLVDSWSSRYTGGRHFSRTVSECLSATPLTEALIASQTIINEFRQQNNLDIVNLCVVHDGDADDTSSYLNAHGNRTYFRPNTHNVFICDPKIKMQIQVKTPDDGVRAAVGEWLMKTTGANIIGFYLAPDSHMRGALKRRLFNDEVDAVRKKDVYSNAYSDIITKYGKILRKEKFLESRNPGYKSFFILAGGDDLDIKDDSFDKPDVVSANTLTKAFGKYTKARQVNRVLVSRFISLIAA